MIQTIRESYDDAKENLMNRFGLSDVQAQAILDMQLKRLQGLENAADELSQWQEIQTAAESIPQDAKAGELLTVLKQGFSLMKKTGAKQKAVIFTESVETQKMLQNLLSDRYRTLPTTQRRLLRDPPVQGGWRGADFHR